MPGTPRSDFPPAIRARILPRLANWLRSGGAEVRVITRDAPEPGEFQFHPELYEQRARASELLEAAGYTWFSGAVPLTSCTRNMAWSFFPAFKTSGTHQTDPGRVAARLSPLASHARLPARPRPRAGLDIVHQHVPLHLLRPRAARRGLIGALKMARSVLDCASLSRRSPATGATLWRFRRPARPRHHAAA